MTTESFIRSLENAFWALGGVPQVVVFDNANAVVSQADWYEWLYTLVELASWDADATQLVDRSARPWDNPERRPSHADRRRKIAGEMLRNEFPPTPAPTPEAQKILALFETLLTLCT